MLGGGYNATTYNTLFRDNASLSASEFALITYVYKNNYFDLYFGGKYWGRCPVIINQPSSPDFSSGTWNIGEVGLAGFAQGELTSLIIFDKAII